MMHVHMQGRPVGRGTTLLAGPRRNRPLDYASGNGLVPPGSTKNRCRTSLLFFQVLGGDCLVNAGTVYRTKRPDALSIARYQQS